MSKSSAVYARIDTNLKEKAEEILSKLGISPSALIQMTYSQVILNNGLPFEAKLPYKKPVAVGNMTKEELSAELEKGIESLKNGKYSAADVDAQLRAEFGI